MTPSRPEGRSGSADRVSTEPATAGRVDTMTLIRRGAGVVLAVLSILFAALNLDTVQINWIFVTGETPLIIVILTCLLVGVALGLIIARRGSR